MNLRRHKAWISALVSMGFGLACSFPATSGAQVDYVVPPTVVSPKHGALIQNNPLFTEPAMLHTGPGFVTA